MENEMGIEHNFTQDGTTNLKGVLRSNTGKWRACYFMLGYGMCERMAYYGIATNLVLYLTREQDQFDEFEPKEKAHKLTFFNWWMVSILFGTLFSNTFLVYLQDRVGWSLGYGIPTLALLVAIIGFIIGTPIYRHKPKKESPFTRMAKVLVATFRKWNVVVPIDPKELHELSLDEYSSPEKYRIDHSSSLRFLDKAAVKIEEPASEWKLCPVTQVEQTKQMIKMLPILFATFIPSTLFAQTNTLFVRQGTTLVRSMGPNFEIPPASLGVFLSLSMLITIAVYDRLFVPLVRKYTKNPRGITLLQRMTIGTILHIINMIIASLVERRRLRVAKDHGITQKGHIVPLSIFILLPQFAIMGIADCFLEVGKLEFFYDQAPEGMKSIGTAYYTTSMGVGFFLSSFILSTVADVTKGNGHKGWILNNVNESRLDYYYWFFTILSFVNFLCFLVAAKNFNYNAEVDRTKQELEQDMEI